MDTFASTGNAKNEVRNTNEAGNTTKNKNSSNFLSFFSQFLANIWSKKFQIMENTKKYISRKSFSRLRWNF